MRVDFHMHSTFSDGVEIPEQLLQHAVEADLKMIALTDHDEIAGIDTMLAIESPIQIITGCEFSAHYKGKDIHILGYGFNHHDEGLHKFIHFFKEKRESRIKNIISRCIAHGYNISFTELEDLYPNTKSYGRPHVARLLIDHGYAKDVQEVFDGILNSKSPCYIPKVKLEVPEILDIIHNANGLAVLAHPKLVRNDDYVTELLDYSFDGVEVYHSKHDQADEQKYLAMAKERNLFITGGSDYHGIPNRYPYHIGEYVVDSHLVNRFIEHIRCISA